MVFVTSIEILWIVFCVIQKYEQMFMSSMRQYFLSTSSVQFLWDILKCLSEQTTASKEVEFLHAKVIYEEEKHS